MNKDKQPTLSSEAFARILAHMPAPDTDGEHKDYYAKHQRRLNYAFSRFGVTYRGKFRLPDWSSRVQAWIAYQLGRSTLPSSTGALASRTRPVSDDPRTRTP